MSKVILSVALALSTFTAFAESSSAKFSIPNGSFSRKEHKCGYSINVDGNTILLRLIKNKYVGQICDQPTLYRGKITSCTADRCEIESNSPIKAISKLGPYLEFHFENRSSVMIPNDKVWSNTTNVYSRRVKFSYSDYAGGERYVIPALTNYICQSSTAEYCQVTSYNCDNSVSDYSSVVTYCDFVVHEASERD